MMGRWPLLLTARWPELGVVADLCLSGPEDVPSGDGWRAWRVAPWLVVALRIRADRDLHRGDRIA
jgi:hypothetical protein